MEDLNEEREVVTRNGETLQQIIEYTPRLVVPIPEPPPDMINFTNGFKFRFKPEKVIHRKLIDNKHFYLIQWTNVEQMSYVKSKIATKECPDLVWEFYQRHYE